MQKITTTIDISPRMLLRFYLHKENEAIKNNDLLLATFYHNISYKEAVEISETMKKNPINILKL
jgi:hypothetical protein